MDIINIELDCPDELSDMSYFNIQATLDKATEQVLDSYLDDLPLYISETSCILDSWIPIVLDAIIELIPKRRGSRTTVDSCVEVYPDKVVVSIINWERNDV